MAANPQLVTKDIPAGTFTYDGVRNTRIPRGTVIDVPNGSALATALAGFIATETAQQCTPVTSDSVNPATLENVNGYGYPQQGWPGTYNWGQN